MWLKDNKVWKKMKLMTDKCSIECNKNDKMKIGCVHLIGWCDSRLWYVRQYILTIRSIQKLHMY